MGKLTFVYDVQASGALGSLAALDMATVNSKIDGSRERGFRITKTMYDVDIYGYDGTEDGPVAFGLAVGMTAAEIEEAIEADPQSPNDVAAEERVGRAVFPLGVIPRSGPSTPSNQHEMRELKTTSINWSVPEGSGLVWWFYNYGGALGAGNLASIFAKHFGVWLND